MNSCRNIVIPKSEWKKVEIYRRYYMYVKKG